MSDPNIPTLVVSGKMANMGESLSAIRQFVTDASQQAGLDKQAMYRLILAVDEIATNIFTYGYKDANSDPRIDVHAKITDGTLMIALEDDAPAFDPTEHQVSDDLDSDLDQRSIGGLGVYLALNNVDGFQYEHANGRNRNIFMMKRQ